MPIDFRIRDYLMPRAIWRLRRTLERTQWMDPAERRALLDDRLRRVVAHARSRVPYYRRRLSGVEVRGVADLARLPILTREDLARAGADLCADDASRRGARLHSTSGTSGAPVRFWLDRDARALEFCYYWRHFSWAGYRLGDPICELGTVHFLRRGLDRPLDWQPWTRRLMVHAGQMRPSGAAEIARALARHRPRYLKGMASSLVHLATCLTETGRAGYEFQGVFSTGEQLRRGARLTIERAFGAPVLDSYGHMERTVAISQCPRGGYHVNDDYGVLELVTAGDEASAGLSRAVGTSLYNLSMPLLRYDTGDWIESFPEPRSCPCGRTLPLVKAIRGRRDAAVVTQDGRAVSSLFVLFDLVRGVHAAQVVQESLGEVELRVVPGGEFDDAEAAELARMASEVLGPTVRLRVRRIATEELERGDSGKPRPVVSRVAASEGDEA